MGQTGALWRGGRGVVSAGKALAALLFSIAVAFARAHQYCAATLAGVARVMIKDIL